MASSQALAATLLEVLSSRVALGTPGIGGDGTGGNGSQIIGPLEVFRLPSNKLFTSPGCSIWPATMSVTVEALNATDRCSSE